MCVCIKQSSYCLAQTAGGVSINHFLKLLVKISGAVSWMSQLETTYLSDVYQLEFIKIKSKIKCRKLAICISFDDM